MPDLVTLVAAFALGAALARANSCTVASARRLVFEHRADWLAGLVVAVSWAGVTLAAFSIMIPQLVVLPNQLPIGLEVVAGGILLGIGATVNQGCFLGSFARLGRGEISFLFTLIGIALVMAFVPVSGPDISLLSASPTAAQRHADTAPPASIAFLPFALFGLWNWWHRRRQTMLALIAVGIAGGTVYACNPDWSYTSGLYRLFRSGGTTQSWLQEGATVALVAGVGLSAALASRFSVRPVGVVTAALRLTGGALMGTGAMLVPGGNDTLMLWAIPGLTIYGPIAYAVMLATIVGLLAISRCARTRMPNTTHGG